MAFVSGIFLGIGLSQVRILCSFKMVRAKSLQQNYNFMKPFFFTFLFA